MDKLPIDQDPARAAALAALQAPDVAALIAQGVPALVLAADPPRLVLATGAAAALFEARDEETLALRVAAGGEAAFARLLQLNKSLRPGAPARRERLSVPPGSVTFSLQRVTGTPPLLVAVAPEVTGLALAAPAPAPAPVPEPAARALSPGQTDVPTATVLPPAPVIEPALPAEAAALASTASATTLDEVAGDLARRFDDAAVVRILWQTDGHGRIVALTGPLADILHLEDARLIGRSLVDLAREAGADPDARLAQAIASRETWSHLDLDWPIAGMEAAVRIVFGGSPIRREGSFDGYRGFGVIHLETITPRRPPRDSDTAATPEATIDLPPEQAVTDLVLADVAPMAVVAPEVVAPAPEIDAEKAAADLPPADAPVDDAARALPSAATTPGEEALPPDAVSGPEPGPAASTNVVQLRPNRPAPSMTELSPSERNAFREIARALGAKPQAADDRSERPAPRAVEPTSADASTPASGRDQPLIPSNPRVRDLIEIASRARSLADEMGRDEDLEPADTFGPDEGDELQPASNNPQSGLDLARADLASAADDLPDSPEGEAKAPATDAQSIALAADPADSALGQQLRALVDRLPVGVLISRLEIPIYLNRTLLDLLGYESADEFHDAGGIDHMFRGRSPELLAEGAAGGAIPLVTHAGEVLAVEARVQAVSWEGDPATMICLRPSREAETLARLRATEQDLRGRDAELREMHAILDTATDGVALIDDEGRLLSLNRAAQALFGYEPNELLGETFTTLLVRESHSIAMDYLAGLRSSGVASVMNDGRDVMGRARQGGSIPLFLTLGRVTAGGSNKFCMVLRDMTSWKKAERELNEARRQAERASALKSDFLAKVSHEIRTPLNAILGFAEVIMEERFGPVGNERYKDYLKDIHASGTHVMSLVNDLLDLSKIEAGRLELNFGAVDANKIVSECVSLMQPQAARDRVIIRMSLAQHLPNIVADERSLRQIVLNLLSNGVKFNEPGGQVIVSTALTDAGHAVIRIRDTGIGMTEAEAQVAMEPFRQLATARVTGGTGLGLPLTKALVEANRASFTIKSKKKEGTLIEVAFPPTRVLAE